MLINRVAVYVEGCSVPEPLELCAKFYKRWKLSKKYNS